jgi:hypothetical protein
VKEAFKNRLYPPICGSTFVMARFSDFSSEVIVMISNFVQPRDLDSFFLTSKHIGELNQACIAEHSTLKKNYKHLISHTNFDGIANFGTLANSLRKVLTVPRAASYVEDLDIRGWHMGWINGSHLDDRRSNDMLSEENRILFNAATLGSKYVTADLVDAWMGGFEDGMEDQIVGLLLIVLPNLSALNLMGVCDWDNLVTDTIDRISQDPKLEALTMLKCVTISGKETPTPLHVVKSLAALPSMRQIHAENVSTTSEDQYASPPDSKVTSLCLLKCIIGPEFLHEFLGSFTSLFTFEYTDGTRFRDDAEPGSNAFWICNSLKHHAKHSLRKLTLRSPYRKNSTIIGFLQTLEVLEELDVDFGALLNSRLFGIGYGRLNQVLPASIKKVTLRHFSGAGVMESGFHVRIVHHVIMQGKQALPHLQALNFRPKKNSKTLKFSLRDIAACEAAGITLTVD